MPASFRSNAKSATCDYPALLSAIQVGAFVGVLAALVVARRWYVAWVREVRKLRGWKEQLKFQWHPLTISLIKRVLVLFLLMGIVVLALLIARESC